MRRLCAFALTLAAWIAWVAMWVPVFGVFAVWLGLPPLPGAYPSQENVIALRGLLLLFPTAFAAVIGILAVNGVIGLVYRRLAPPKPLPLVGMERLATGMALDVDKLAAWQSARILHVQHGPLGRVTDASIVR